MTAPPPPSVTLQVTAVLALLDTVAVSCCTRPTLTVALAGATATPTGGSTVTVAEAVPPPLELKST